MEAENYHGENVVLLAKHFGTKEDLKEAKRILAEHEKQGSLTDKLRKERDELHHKLYPKFVKALKEESVIMAKGGHMAKGGGIYGTGNADFYEERTTEPYDFKDYPYKVINKVEVDYNLEYDQAHIRSTIMRADNGHVLRKETLPISSYGIEKLYSMLDPVMRGMVRRKFAKGGHMAKGSQMGEYATWEMDVADELSDIMNIDYSDAQGVMDVNYFYIAQSWGKALSPKETAMLIYEKSKLAKGGYMAKGGMTNTAKYYWNMFDMERRKDFLITAGYSPSVADNLKYEDWDSLETGVHRKLTATLLAQGGELNNLIPHSKTHRTHEK